MPLWLRRDDVRERSPEGWNARRERERKRDPWLCKWLIGTRCFTCRQFECIGHSYSGEHRFALMWVLFAVAEQNPHAFRTKMITYKMSFVRCVSRVSRRLNVKSRPHETALHYTLSTRTRNWISVLAITQLQQIVPEAIFQLGLSLTTTNCIHSFGTQPHTDP